MRIDQSDQSDYQAEEGCGEHDFADRMCVDQIQEIDLRGFSIRILNHGLAQLWRACEMSRLLIVKLNTTGETVFEVGVLTFDFQRQI